MRLTQKGEKNRAVEHGREDSRLRETWKDT